MYLKSKIAGETSIMLLVIIGCLFQCSLENVSGISVVGNPESVIALIVDESGIPQKDVPVALVPINYNAVKQNDSLSLATGITDSAGKVVLKLGIDSAYNLTSTNQHYRYRLMQKVKGSASTNGDLIKKTEPLHVQLKKPGTIVVTFDSVSFKSGNYLSIPGTLIKMEIKAPGKYELVAPAGILSVKYCSSSKDTTNERRIDSLNVVSSDTVKITAIATENTFHTERTDTVTIPTYSDSIMIPVTYYDFHSNRTNPEFECASDSGLTSNMVADSLDSDMKPVGGSVINRSKNIAHWFRNWIDIGVGNYSIPVYGPTNAYLNDAISDYDTAFKNITIIDSLLFRHVGNGIYTYNNDAFFPLDGKGFGNEGLYHNYSFTMEMSLTLKNCTNSVMRVSGDDDIWVYVNGKLVLDLGGIHEEKTDSLSFNDSMLNKSNSGHDLKLFKTERHTTVSTLMIQLKLF